MRLSPLVGLWVAAVSFGASAQGFELDLSEPEVPAEFRPTIAVLGVASGETTEDPVITGRARQIEAELLKSVSTNASFGKVMDPTAAASALGGKLEAARKCIDYACLDTLARELKVDRIIKGTITKSGPASLLTLHGFDAALPEVAIATVESGERQEKAQIGGFAGIQGKSQTQKDKEFVKKVFPAFSEVLKKIATPNGKLLVDSGESTSLTTLNGIELGLGSFEKVVGRGTYELKTTAAGYLPFDTKVTVVPQQTATVKVLLAAKPLEGKRVPLVTQESTGTPPLKRPGLYIAAAGIVLAAVGLAVGIGAKGVEGRAVDKDGDGAVDITRTQAKSAQGSATVANALVGVGAAATVGGAVWFFLTPGVTKRDEPPAGPADQGPSEGAGFGVMAGFGGKF